MPPASWAKRTGFRPKFSGETNATDSGQVALPSRPKATPDAHPDLEAGRLRGSSAANGEPEKEKEKDQTVKRRRDSDGLPKGSGQGQNGQALPPPPDAAPAQQQPRRPPRNEDVVDVLPQTGGDDDGFVARHSHMKYELRDTPGLGEFHCFNGYKNTKNQHSISYYILDFVIDKFRNGRSWLIWFYLLVPKFQSRLVYMGSSIIFRCWVRWFLFRLL